MNSSASQPATGRPLLNAPWRARWFPNNEWVLIIVLIVECSVFALTGNNFLSSANAFEVTRLSAEIGLLALALTPIIITGGIDLSVGSMMGLSAVVLGSLWRAARYCYHIDDRTARRRSECADDRAIEVPSADRNAWDVFSLSRNCRRTYS